MFTYEYLDMKFLLNVLTLNIRSHVMHRYRYTSETLCLCSYKY